MTAARPLYNDGVFINCPFDGDYAETFRALVFAIYACEFRPRSALEIGDSSQARIEKIYDIVETCRFGIHDLSRTELDVEHGLPRFNMPLELDIFLGARRFGSKPQKLKRALVLDVDRHRYQRFISDLAGMDIHAHGGDPVRALKVARDWLANVSRRRLPSAERLARVHAAFQADLPALASELDFDVRQIPYVDFERIVTEWLLDAPPLK